jgi:hypothetical protein
MVGPPGRKLKVFEAFGRYLPGDNPSLAHMAGQRKLLITISQAT